MDIRSSSFVMKADTVLVSYLHSGVHFELMDQTIIAGGPFTKNMQVSIRDDFLDTSFCF